jgi:CMP-N,N'-diacetyllegionaminic acid synthase
MSPNIYTVIPARGGSKSIPKKNIKPLNGYPLIKYSIDYSNSCSLVNRTIVSTDDEEIAEIAQDLGADVPFMRPQSLGGDLVEDYPVILHALNAMEKIYKETIDIIILLRPTSPLRPPSLIESGIDLLNNDPAATSVRAVSKSTEHPYRQWSLQDGYITGFSNSLSSKLEPFNLPRQELPEVFFQTGDIEIIRRKTLKNGTISGDRILPLTIDSDQVYDIDNQEDFDLAERNLETAK